MPAVVYAKDAATKEKSNESIAVGSTIPDFGFPQLSKKTGKLSRQILFLSNFLEDGDQSKKLLVVNFYAIWCKPCLKEIPILEKLHQKYSAKGVQFVSVNYRNQEESAKKIIQKTRSIVQKYHITYPILISKYYMRKVYLAYLGQKAQLPFSIIVNPKGMVISKFQGSKGVSFKKLEQEILKNLPIKVGHSNKIIKNSN